MVAHGRGALRAWHHDREGGLARGVPSCRPPIPLEAAQRARAAGTPTFVLCSAVGADPASRFFYNRVKGELERDLAAVDFASLTLVRPGIIDGDRAEHRAAEQWFLRAMRMTAPLLPRAWRPSPASRIARAMLDAALSAPAGRHVVDSATLAG